MDWAWSLHFTFLEVFMVVVQSKGFRGWLYFELANVSREEEQDPQRNAKGGPLSSLRAPEEGAARRPHCSLPRNITGHQQLRSELAIAIPTQSSPQPMPANVRLWGEHVPFNWQLPARPAWKSRVPAVKLTKRSQMHGKLCMVHVHPSESTQQQIEERGRAERSGVIIFEHFDNAQWPHPRHGETDKYKRGIREGENDAAALPLRHHHHLLGKFHTWRVSKMH